jgi:hypothetical protein
MLVHLAQQLIPLLAAASLKRYTARENQSLLGGRMTPQEEQYVHFVSSIDNLNNTWRILQEIRQCKGSPLIGPAFQVALVEYAKPYRYSRSTVAKGIKYKLEDLHIPAKHCELHMRILAARDQIHAHSDLTVKEAKLCVANTASGKYTSRVQNAIRSTEELSNIDSIIELIEQNLDNMHIEAKRLEAALPINS